MPTGAGDPPCQEDLNMFKNLAPVRTLGKIADMGTVPARTFQQVADVEVKSVSDDDHAMNHASS